MKIITIRRDITHVSILWFGWFQVSVPALGFAQVVHQSLYSFEFVASLCEHVALDLLFLYSCFIYFWLWLEWLGRINLGRLSHGIMSGRCRNGPLISGVEILRLFLGFFVIMVFWASIQRKTDIPSFHSLPEYEFHLIFREGNIHSMIEFMNDRRITSIPSVLWRNEWMEDTWMGDTKDTKMNGW